jgi:hypothetical protein
MRKYDIMFGKNEAFPELIPLRVMIVFYDALRRIEKSYFIISKDTCS